MKLKISMLIVVSTLFIWSIGFCGDDPPKEIKPSGNYPNPFNEVIINAL